MKKGNVKMLIRNLREMEENKQCTLHDVVGSGTELLCVDVGSAMWLTKDKKYTLIEEENENYLIESDQKLKNWYSKNKFKVLEAQ